MLDMHTKNGYLELMLPALVNSESLRSGQLPKFANESFQCSNDDLWLSPTAEVPLTAFHKNDIVDFKHLLLSMLHIAHVLGGSWKLWKGYQRSVRLHQFNKAELYWFCDPSKSLRLIKRLLLMQRAFWKTQPTLQIGRYLYRRLRFFI